MDTSVLAGLFIDADAFAGRARAFFDRLDEAPLLSDFVSAEFASIVARLHRMTAVTMDDANRAFALFDRWRAAVAEEIETTQADVRVAAVIIRRMDMNLRAPDAINLAMADRMGAAIATFDPTMAANARALNIAVAD